MANWSAIGALGEAAKASGDYFGVLAVEKTRTQRLAEARAEQLADKADDRAYNQNLRLQGIGDQEAIRDEARLWEKNNPGHKGMQKGQNGNYFSENEQGTLVDTGISFFDPSEDSSSSSPWKHKGDSRVDPKTGDMYDKWVNEDTQEVEYRVVGMGAPDSSNTAPTVAEEGDISSVDEAPVEAPVEASLRVSDLGKLDEKPDKLTAEQSRLIMRADAGNRQLDMIGNLITGSETSKPFDPASFKAWYEKSMNTVGVLRGLSSKESQLFDTAAEAMVAGILRTDTGAAAPTEEQIRYTARLIPRFGEDPDVIAWKMLNLRTQFAAMAAAGDPKSTAASIQAAATEADRLFRKNNPAPEGIAEYVNTDVSNNPAKVVTDYDVETFMGTLIPGRKPR